MFSAEDTIVAVATPYGRGGIGVVRISGPHAAAVARVILRRSRPLQPRVATLTRVYQADCEPAAAIDQVLATYFPAPASYTGEDVVEVSGHGSPMALEQIIEAAMHAGARLAEPGEFTLRCFLNGRIDLVQAEAVADLIDAVTPAQARVAFDQLEGTLTTVIGEIDAALFDLIARLEASLDFSTEGYHFIDASMTASTLQTIAGRIRALLEDGRRGRVIREGRQVAILGKPNTGKSSLFNSLLGSERAIVTAVAGTTRDLVTETIDLDGIPVRLIDTAGIHDTTGEVESKGVTRARHTASVADLAVLVFDRSRPFDEDDQKLLAATADRHCLFVVNKTDLATAWTQDPLGEARALSSTHTSMTTQDGLGELRESLVRALGLDARLRDGGSISNIRHIRLVEQAQRSLDRGMQAASAGRSEEFVLADLQEARAALEEVTGRRTPDEVLQHIFQRFCVGK